MDPTPRIYGYQEKPLLRDQIAVAALVAVILSDEDSTHQEKAKEAYLYADAMLQARETYRQ